MWNRRRIRTKGILQVEEGISLSLSGCAGLVLKDQDTSSERTQKITARVLLCVVSLCFSEIFQTWPNREYAIEQELKAYRVELDAARHAECLLMAGCCLSRS